MTANHPEGLTVPIRFDGLLPPKTTQEPVTPVGPTKADGPVVEKEPITPALPLLTAHPAEDEQVNTLFRVGSFYDLRCE